MLLGARVAARAPRRRCPSSSPSWLCPCILALRALLVLLVATAPRRHGPPRRHRLSGALPPLGFRTTRPHARRRLLCRNSPAGGCSACLVRLPAQRGAGAPVAAARGPVVCGATALREAALQALREASAATVLQVAAPLVLFGCPAGSVARVPQGKLPPWSCGPWCNSPVGGCSAGRGASLPGVLTSHVGHLPGCSGVVWARA